MKLMTKMDGMPGDMLLTYNGDIGVSADDQAEHDAAAAHALMRAMDRVSSQVTFHTMTNRECVAQLLDAVRGTADELMAEWGFDREKVES